MRQTPEGKVKADIRKLLKSEGIWHYMPVQNGMGVVGIPDFVCCWNGLFITIETKAPNKTPTTFAQRWAKATPNQQNRMVEIMDAGGVAIIADDVSQVVQVLNAIRPMAKMTRTAMIMMRARKWHETIKGSIESTMALLSRKRKGPCVTRPEEPLSKQVVRRRVTEKM